jgi:hypothetical protein
VPLRGTLEFLGKRNDMCNIAGWRSWRQGAFVANDPFCHRDCYCDNHRRDGAWVERLRVAFYASQLNNRVPL